MNLPVEATRPRASPALLSLSKESARETLALQACDMLQKMEGEQPARRSYLSEGGSP
ncbi:MAG: hypothetical protein JXR37_23315 [Kiritimatiellae bacterium]|nr:hypothetical protein [Kiritimatiellia bacterium]